MAASFEDCKFQVGQMVRLKADTSDKIGTPVIQRVLIQCAGGTQKFYEVRLYAVGSAFGHKDVSKPLMFSECELEAIV